MLPLQTDTVFDEAAFRADQTEASLQSVRLAALLGMLAFIAFALVDPFFATDGVEALLVVRAGLVAVLITVLPLTSVFGAGVRQGPWLLVLSVGTCLFIGFGVIAVTALAGGAAANYHEALLITFFGFSALRLPWKWPLSLATYAVIVVAYDLVMAALDLRGQPAQWLTVNTVLWFSVVVASAITWLTGTGRRQEFMGRTQLAAANARLQELDSAKTAFFTNISHELRTPLTLVLAPLESVLEGGDALSPAQEDQLRLARRSALRLLRLVDDLLVLSRIEGDALRLYTHTFSLRDLVRKLTEEAATLAARTGVTVTFAAGEGADVRVHADEEQIERVVLNLLANALKFTPPDGSITVGLTSGPQGVEVSVADTGPGIPEAHLERVFERFYQVDSSSGRRVGGTGIGLSLARNLIQLHGGEMRAAPNPGGGAIVRFRLPAVRERFAVEPVPVKEELPVGLTEWHNRIRRGDDYRLIGLDDAVELRVSRQAGGDGRRATILLIEDNADMVRFVSGVLGGSYAVIDAPDGQAGLRLAFERRPDLIVSDVMMPGLTGWEVLARLRADEHTRSIPVVMLTARGAPEDRMLGQAQGADAYLTKPFQVAELRAVIRGLLRNHDDREALSQARTDAELDAMVAGLLATIGRPGARLIADPADRAAADALAHGLSVLASFVPASDADAARVEADVHPTVRAVVEGIGDPRVTVDAGATHAVAFAPERLSRALAELVDNALRAGPDHTAVVLRTRNTPDGGVGITVEDAGPGVPGAARDLIFQPFYSTHGRLGLGLTLARRLVRDEGGALALDTDDRPSGARFSIRLGGPRSAR